MTLRSDKKAIYGRALVNRRSYPSEVFSVWPSK